MYVCLKVCTIYKNNRLFDSKYYDLNQMLLILLPNININRTIKLKQLLVLYCCDVIY